VNRCERPGLEPDVLACVNKARIARGEKPLVKGPGFTDDLRNYTEEDDDCEPVFVVDALNGNGQKGHWECATHRAEPEEENREGLDKPVARR